MGDQPMTMLQPAVKYFESHITIEPVFGRQLARFKYITSMYDFKAADLLLMTDRDATPKRSDKDTFCTGRSVDFQIIDKRMRLLVDALKAFGFQVWRYKIEAVLVDERLKP